MAKWGMLGFSMLASSQCSIFFLFNEGMIRSINIMNKLKQLNSKNEKKKKNRICQIKRQKRLKNQIMMVSGKAQGIFVLLC